MSQEFHLTHDVDLPATPEQVWEAIATGPGVDSWFMGKNEIEPCEGGTASMVMPGFTGESTVTAWEPPHRFGYRSAPGLTPALGLSEQIHEGDKMSFTIAGQTVDGVVDTVLAPTFLGVRTADALLRFVGGGGVIMTGHHIFADIDPTDSEQAWGAWLASVYA